MEASTEGYDHMIAFHVAQNEFFKDLAVSDAHQAVLEITDYMLACRHDPPIVFHIELMGILAEAYERSGQFRFAQIALDEVEYLSRDLRLPADEGEDREDVEKKTAAKDMGETEAREDMGETEAQEADNSLPDVGGLQLEDQSPIEDIPTQAPAVDQKPPPVDFEQPTVESFKRAQSPSQDEGLVLLPADSPSAIGRPQSDPGAN